MPPVSRRCGACRRGVPQAPRRFFRSPCWRGSLLLLWLGVAAGQTQPLVVGQVLSLTGPTAAFGRDLLDGSQACVDRLNAEGGVAGRPLRLLTRDDGGDPALSLQHARALLERDHVVALLGPMGPATNAVVLPWAAQAGLAVIGPHAGDVGSRLGAGDTSFFLTANHSVEAGRLAAHLQSLGVRRVVMAYTDDELGRSAVLAFEEALSVAGIDAPARLVLQADGRDAASVGRAALAAQPQAIVLGSPGSATIGLLRGLGGTRGLYGVYALSFSATPRELESLGAGARGLVMTQVLPAINDGRYRLVQVHRAAMQAAGRTALSAATLEGCLGPLVLAEALRSRGGGATDRAGVLKALRSAGTVHIGDLAIPLADHDQAGIRYSDIVTIGPDGRVVR
jgi:ABC-type branched-subunit amino acid transport system substrate-binding protein